MSHPAILRLATADDAPALVDILHDTFESTWRPALTPAATEAFRAENRPAKYVSARELKFWAAEIEGDVVGFCDWDADFINALHVRADHARTGIGRLLMDKAESEIARAGFSAARLETDTFNTRSQAFYAARDYVEIDRYPDLEWKSDLTTLLLRKPLR